jgi:hypothetical protein
VVGEDRRVAHHPRVQQRLERKRRECLRHVCHTRQAVSYVSVCRVVSCRVCVVSCRVV